MPRLFTSAALMSPSAVAYLRFLLVHLLGGVSPTSPYIGLPTLSPVISYGRTEMVHIPRGAPATPPFIGTPPPPLVVSYQGT